MGADIHGWVEVQPHPDSPYPSGRDTWYGVMKVTELLVRNYDMMASLFGVRDYAAFTPIAPARGLPVTISESASDDYISWEGGAFGETWISWHEIQSIDWTDSAVDKRPHRYIGSAGGELVYESKAEASEIDYAAGYEPGREGHTWERLDGVYKIERITRQDALESAPSWKLLFDLMGRLAQDYGEDCVRFVAWFDC